MKELDVETTPNLLNPLHTEKGVKKLNKLPIIIFTVIVAIIIASFSYALLTRGQQQKDETKEETAKPKSENGNNIVAGLLEELKSKKELENSRKKQEENINKNIQEPTTSNIDNKFAFEQNNSNQNQIKMKENEKEDEIKKLKDKLYLDALTSNTKMQNSVLSQNTSNNANDFVKEMLNQSKQNNPNKQQSNILEKYAKTLLGAGEIKDTNQDFLDNASKSYDYISSVKTAQISPYEIKTGTIIPGTLISGINSELPGQILGQVAENVYDTATGDHLLIPQGTKLIGVYNSDVAYGQSRVLIAWTRLVYPDGKTLNIGSMNGTDQQGYAGFEDQVNNHYFRIFGSAFLLSMLGGEIKIDNGKLTFATQGAKDQDNTETVLERTASKMIEKNLGIAPTLEIRPGYKFNIFITKDMILEPLQLQ